MSTNSLSKVDFAAIHKNMMEIFAKETKEAWIEAGEIATKLLAYPELPMLYRIRSHIVLAHGQYFYLWHARKAVEAVDFSLLRFGRGDTLEEQKGFELLFREAAYVLQRALANAVEFENDTIKMEAERGNTWPHGMEEEDFNAVSSSEYEGKRYNLSDHIPQLLSGERRLTDSDYDESSASTATETTESRSTTKSASQSDEPQPFVAPDHDTASQNTRESIETQRPSNDQRIGSEDHASEVHSLARVSGNEMGIADGAHGNTTEVSRTVNDQLKVRGEDTRSTSER